MILKFKQSKPATPSMEPTRRRISMEPWSHLNKRPKANRRKKASAEKRKAAEGL